jgi:hypothetical protein
MRVGLNANFQEGIDVAGNPLRPPVGLACQPETEFTSEKNML